VVSCHEGRRSDCASGGSLRHTAGGFSQLTKGIDILQGLPVQATSLTRPLSPEVASWQPGPRIRGYLKAAKSPNRSLAGPQLCTMEVIREAARLAGGKTDRGLPLRGAEEDQEPRYHDGKVDFSKGNEGWPSKHPTHQGRLLGSHTGTQGERHPELNEVLAASEPLFVPINDHGTTQSQTTRSKW